MEEKMTQEKAYPWQPDIPEGYVRVYSDHTCRWYEDISKKKLEREKREREDLSVPFSSHLNKKKRRHNLKSLRKRKRAAQKRLNVMLLNILQEEIRKEIDKEIIAKIVGKVE
jgi:threonyl-tRNA synthetase